MYLRIKSDLPFKIPPRIYLIVGLLIILSLACNRPEQPSIETSVAQTVAAAQPGAPPPAVDEPGSAAAEPTSTFTPEVSDTPTLTPTITLTPTPDIAMILVSENTNCRTGPGVVYDWLVTMQKGDQSEAVAVDPTGDYWYIRRPGQPSSYCWLWGEYATPSGPYQALPVFTPIPTPTQGFDFKITYHSNVGSCSWFWVLQYRIDNIGGFTLESWKTTTTDNTGGSDPIPNEQDKFYDISSCLPTGEQVDLTPGEAYYVNAVFDNNPAGHDLTVKIKICTEDGLGGECLSKTIRHTP